MINRRGFGKAVGRAAELGPAHGPAVICLHGHNLPQEAPTAFAQAVIDVDRF